MMMMMTTSLFPAAFVGFLTCVVLILQPITAQDPANSNFFHVTEWQGTVPSLSTFATYEDMNDYIASRANRRLRHLANPTDDTYIDAFNQHNEQATEELSKARPKREALHRKLPNEPRLLQFDVSDAVEPNDETKRLIRQHRTRETSQHTTKSSKNATRTTPTDKKSARNSTRSTNGAVDFGTRVRVGRSKRNSPQNFKVELIPFQASDAREPDEETRKLIKRMRSLELEKLERSQATHSPLPTPRIPPAKPSVQPSPITSTILPSVLPTLPEQQSRRSKIGKSYTKSPRKRTRRAITQQTAPKMIKFELEDAKEPDDSMKALISLSRESKEMKGDSLQESETEENNATTRLIRKSDSPEVGPEIDDQSSDESRRFLFYKDSPVKVKKSINSLPHDVQKVITHFIKDSQGAKAYIKYLPTQQMDYNQLRTVPYAVANGVAANYQGQKAAVESGGAYVNYIQPPPQLQLQPKQVQLQIQSVPVMEKLRYIYTPVANAAALPQVVHQQPYLPQHYAAVSPAPIQQHLIAEPIVVPEAEYVKQAAPQLTEVHHTYTADLSYANEQGKAEAPQIQHVQQAPVQQFHASRLDPYLEENKIGAGAAAAAAEVEVLQEQQQAQLQQQQQLQLQQEKQKQQQQQNIYTIPVENYKYELFSKSPQVPQGYVAEFSNAKQQQGSQQELPVGPAAASNQASNPVIKIEYHGPPDALKENYKQMTEFKELSALMGKSPEDQIHGLTYLLAKEMQSKLKQKRQEKPQLDQLRPQDNTSPVLFHPPDYEGLAAKIPSAGAEQANVYAQPGRLIGMGKSKQYIPIMEQPDAKAVAANSAEAFEQQQQLLYEGDNGGAKSGSEMPAPTSFVQYGMTHEYRRGAKAPNGLAGAGSAYIPNLQGKQKYSYDAGIFTGSGVGGHGAGGGGGGGVGGGKFGAGDVDGNKFGAGVGGLGSYIGGGVDGGKFGAGVGGVDGNKFGAGVGGVGSYIGGGVDGAKLQLGADAGVDAVKLNGGLNFRTQIDERDSLQYASKYAFGYRVRDFNTGNDFGHKQHRDLDGVTRGQYHILLPDGRIQNVIYHADGTGFHADVSFESGH